MEMQASRTLAVTQQQAWEALNDPEVLKLCIPGCDKVEASGENQYAVAMALKIGPVSAKFAGKITLADIVPPESYTIAFDGSGGVAGFGKGTAQVRLEPAPADASGLSTCELHYTVHATVGGKIAQLGQRLIDGAAKSMAEDFFKRFDEEMQRRYPQADADDGFAPTLIADDAPAGHAGSPLYQDDKKFPAWIWPVGILVVLGLWWYFR